MAKVIITLIIVAIKFCSKPQPEFGKTGGSDGGGGSAAGEVGESSGQSPRERCVNVKTRSAYEM